MKSLAEIEKEFDEKFPMLDQWVDVEGKWTSKPASGYEPAGKLVKSFLLQTIKDLARESLEAVPETQNDVCTCEYHGCFRSCDCWNREDGRMEARSSLEAYWASVLK